MEFKEKELVHYKGLSSELSEKIALTEGAEKDYKMAMHVKALEVEAKEREIESQKALIEEKHKQIEQ